MLGPPETISLAEQIEKVKTEIEELKQTDLAELEEQKNLGID